MKQLLFFILLITTLSASAQAEFAPKFKPIPPTNFGIKPKKIPPTATMPTDIPGIKAPNVFNSINIAPVQSQLNSSYQIGKKDSFSMTPSNEFANPGDRFIPGMEKDLDKTLKDQGLKEGRGALLKQNISFGDFKTKADYFIIRLRDFGAIDGDLVKVSSNDKVIQSEIFLDSNYRDIKIILDKGFNKMEFEALNIGTLGGNTAEIQILDDRKNVIVHDYWNNLAAGFKASVVVTKEE
ncbi:hypothetical protein OIU80_00625 [Flavobacterium sp. LS1R47]|jgi:hypothetical protein|uniref:Secreted protein n=1 Tax=Flavobacterium frigoritolerans TaxID=2987686 RepID=A0A9X2ZJ98_9FLAO|nr:hypothetical protein [Flavobacterium frigoritolerans]MCV9930772.1 hypothetical protein [Flavobacterium frigoritolerans]